MSSSIQLQCFSASHSLMSPCLLADIPRSGVLDLGVETLSLQNMEFDEDKGRQFLQALAKKTLGKKGHPQKNGKMSLVKLLNRISRLPDTAKNRPVTFKIKTALFKQEGYFKRLFSGEPWEEWTEYRTALGRVVSQFGDCVQNQSQIKNSLHRLGKRLIQKANAEAKVLLKELNHPDKSRNSYVEPKKACLKGLFGGAIGSLITKNPLPLVIGLSECLPTAFSQEKVGNEFLVPTNTLDNQRDNSVTGLENGNFVVVWHNYRIPAGPYLNAFGQLFDGNGSKIEDEFQLNTLVQTSWGTNVIGFSDNGFAAVWQSWDTDGDEHGISCQLFHPNRTKSGSEIILNNYTLGSQWDASAASFPNNDFVVTWDSQNQDSSNSTGIYGQLLFRNATKRGGEFPVNNHTANKQRYSSVATFSDRSFVVIWESLDQDGSGFGVYGQGFDGVANKIGNEFPVNNYTTGDQKDADVASFNDGSFVVVWKSSQDGDSDGVYAQLFHGNRSKDGGEFQVNNYTIGKQQDPRVARFPNDDFVVVWVSFDQDGSDDGIYGQMFNRKALRIGNEFRANNHTADAQRRPSIGILKNRKFVVIWMSDLQDGSGWGVFGQIFRDNITFPFSTSTINASDETTFSNTSALISSSQSTSRNSTTSNLSRSSLSTSRTMSSLNLSRFSITNNSSSTPFATEHSTIISTTMENDRTTSSNGFSLLWISLISGGALCICLIGGTVVCILQRRRKSSNSEERLTERDLEARNSFELKPVVKRPHKEIGEQYYQLSKISKEEAQKIYRKTGHMIVFPEDEDRLKYVIGKGNFGAIKVAQRIADEEYVASKKVKGEENIRVSEAEANMQRDAAGDNVLSIYNTIQLKYALYHFMPLAGNGDGCNIQALLAALHNPKLALEILKFIAKDILTGLQTIHAKGIYHLDLKPDNVVFTKDGTGYITDFGCAKKVKGSQISHDAIGDNRYFSPERLQACREGSTFDAEKTDIWAAGMMLLQMIKNF
ncbi:MAG: Serine/threonine-protein kinase StkP, partial [Chlamydiae bacterium]|nr:Serine/threonine-protein kinase StkP [Chlamydiota bacterium]